MPKKKSFFMLLIIMTMMMLSFAAAEDDIHICNGYHYVLLENGTAKIIGWDSPFEEEHIFSSEDEYIQELHIPSALDGYTVTEIGDQVFMWTYVKRFVVPESVVRIGFEAFAANACMTEVILPKTMERIGDRAFHGSLEMLHFQIPDGIRFIPNEMFYCNGLEEIVIPSSVEIIRDSAFSTGYNLRKVVIEEGTRTIGPDAFYYCPCLEEVYLPESLMYIGQDAFSLEPMNAKFKEDCIFYVYADSYAENYCRANNLQYKLR